jgi:hypothetical protein
VDEVQEQHDTIERQVAMGALENVRVVTLIIEDRIKLADLHYRRGQRCSPPARNVTCNYFPSGVDGQAKVALSAVMPQKSRADGHQPHPVGAKVLTAAVQVLQQKLLMGEANAAHRALKRFARRYFLQYLGHELLRDESFRAYRAASAQPLGIARHGVVNRLAGVSSHFDLLLATCTVESVWDWG